MGRHSNAETIDHISFFTTCTICCVDHHAAKEELYYYMRTRAHETHAMLTEFMDHFCEKVCKDKDEADPNM
jgi:hypothetical protein